MFQMFQMDIACVSSEYFQSRSEYCDGYTRMLQLYVPNVSVVSHVVCECVYLNVAYVATATHMLKAYVPNVTSVLDVCCNKFSILQVFHEAQAVPTGRASTRGVAGRADVGEQ
jgi:hypothetical protein